jgi:hypothetical protein
MALHVPKAPGFQSMLKEGARVNTLNFKNFINSFFFIIDYK